VESSTTREYPSLIPTFFQTHIVGEVFLRDEDRALYGLGSNTETGVPYTEDEIMVIVQKGKQRGHLPRVGGVLSGQGTDVLSLPPPRCTHPADLESQPEFDSGSESDGVGDDELGDDEDGNKDEEDADR
nr:hypothetical protein [Tanacetum cinerariifolium]GFA66452.1 hypothetical protein [Tanacetum cinerariifolium]